MDILKVILLLLLSSPVWTMPLCSCNYPVCPGVCQAPKCSTTICADPSCPDGTNGIGQVCTGCVTISPCCGNGSCEPGEDYLNCPADCASPPPPPPPPPSPPGLIPPGGFGCNYSSDCAPNPGGVAHCCTDGKGGGSHMCASTNGGPYCAFGESCSSNAECGPGNCCTSGSCSSCAAPPPPPPPPGPVPPPPGPVPSPTPPPPGSDTPPLVVHDNSTCALTWGWACDGDNYSAPMTVELYLDGPIGVGSLIGTVGANIDRGPGVAALCGGNALHGFTFSAYPPSVINDGLTHQVYMYATNLGPAGPTQQVSPYSYKTFGPCSMPCGTGICGKVYRQETEPSKTSSDALRDMVVELRDANGTIKQQVKTANDGSYVFTSPVNGFITLAVGRKQNASPAFQKAVVGGKYDFFARNIPGMVTVSGNPGALVLFTQASDPDPATPPVIDQASSHVPNVVSATIGLDGKAEVKLRRGQYKMTVWDSLWCGPQMVYAKTPTLQVASGAMIEPQSQIAMTYPAVNCP